MKLTLPASIAIHLSLLGLLFLLPETLAVPRPKLDVSNAVAVIFSPPPPAPAPSPPLQPIAQPPDAPPPPPVVEQPPPPPPPPLVEQPPPPPAAVADTPVPPPKPPEAKPAPKPPKPPPPQPVQQQPVEQPMQRLPLPLPAQAPNAAPQVASIPNPAPAPPTISADYRTLLSGWLESHKRYPEEARQRGEEGRAVLRFRVDRYGRVLDYAVVSSTGYADLDASVQNMMRGASMPPFPPSMTAPEIEVSVTIRFGLSR